MFDAILYKPIINTLVYLYNTIAYNDLGIAIILLTILVRIILFPLFQKSTKQQLVMQKIQPRMKQIQKDHKNDKEKQAKALMDLYKEHKINPFSWILLFIVQIPILIALFHVFRDGFSPDNLAKLYSFVSAPESNNHLFLNLIDLTKASIPLALIAAVLQYLQGKLTMKVNSGTIARQMAIMIWVGPAIALVFLFNLPAAIGIYWITTTLFSIAQQQIIMKNLKENEPVSITTQTT